MGCNTTDLRIGADGCSTSVSVHETQVLGLLPRVVEDTESLARLGKTGTGVGDQSAGAMAERQIVDVESTQPVQ